MPLFTRKKLTVSAAVRCHIGLVRQNNEDNFYFSGVYLPLDKTDAGDSREGLFPLEQDPVFAVCDGMGGEDDGETAAYMAVRGIADEAAERDPDWERALKDISRKISRGSSPGYTRGCTAALIAFSNGRAGIHNVGDSRVYLFRRGRLKQVSRDHSPVYELYEAGALTREEVRLHPRNNIISRFLGMEDTDDWDPFTHSVRITCRPEDIFMICSDGLTDMVPEFVLSEIISAGGTVRVIAQRLLDEALKRGGRDNVTLILLALKDGRT